MVTTGTDAIRVHDLHQWRRVCDDAFVPLHYTPYAREFAGRFRELSSSRTSIAWLSSSALTVERTDRGARTYNGDAVLLMLQLSGTSTVVQHGRIAHLEPGAAVTYDPQAPYTLDFPLDDHEVIVITLDRHSIGLPSRILEQGTAVALDPHAPGTASLQGLVRGLFQDSIALPHAASDLVVSLASTLLAPQQDRAEPGSGALLDSLKSYARAHLGDASLDVRHLAETQYVSPRTVFQLFERTGETPSAWLRRERMHAARRLLSTSTLSVGEVGRAVGYSDSASFSRAFTRETGFPPSTYRITAAPK